MSISIRRLGETPYGALYYGVFMFGKLIGDAYLTANRKEFVVKYFNCQHKNKNVIRTLHIVSYLDTRGIDGKMEMYKIDKYKYGKFAIIFDEPIDEHKLTP